MLYLLGIAIPRGVATCLVSGISRWPSLGMVGAVRAGLASMKFFN